MMKARVLTGDDRISEDVFDVQDGQDHKGSKLLVNQDTGLKVRTNPSRILAVGSGNLVSADQQTLSAKCPQCDVICEVGVAAAAATCPEHGAFDLDWSDIAAGPYPRQAPRAQKTGPAGQPKKARGAAQAQRSRESLTVDFDDLRKHGELWTKSGVEFDYPQYEVLAHVMLIDDAAGARKMCFNSYNGGWGKKSRGSEIRAFITGKPVAGVKANWYQLKKGVDVERRKLAKAGYAKDDA